MEPAKDTVTMRLEGKVIGPWVEECHHAWQAIQIDHGSKKLCLDLRGVSYIDDNGTELLRKIHRLSGAEVLVDSPLTRYFAERITREIERNENEGV